jgi:hypothetical protein
MRATRLPRLAACLVACAALAGCGQIQQYRCVRDMVNAGGPYPSPADRWDAEAMAKDLCAQRAAGK